MTTRHDATDPSRRVAPSHDLIARAPLMRTRIAAPLLALSLAAGCIPGAHSPDVDPDFATDRRSYSAGEDVRLVLRNDSRGSMGVNLCFSVLEQEVGGRWIAAERQADLSCPAVLHTLGPGAEARAGYPLPVRLTSGRYRLVTQVEMAATRDRHALATNPFHVEGEP